MVPTFHYVVLLISPFSPQILESSGTLWSISSSSCNLLTAGSSSPCDSSLHQAAKKKDKVKFVTLIPIHTFLNAVSWLNILEIKAENIH